MLGAKRPLLFVTNKSRPIWGTLYVKTPTGPQTTQSALAMMPRSYGKGGEIGWLVCLGESEDVDWELREPASDRACSNGWQEQGFRRARYSG